MLTKTIPNGPRKETTMTSARALTVGFLLGTAIVAAGIIAARGADNGQFGSVPADVRDWFKAQRSPHGVPCCDIADGHRTAFDMRHDGYYVPIEGEWRQVPPEAVIHGTSNPVGEAVVWYVKQGAGMIYVRCFVPGTAG